MNVNHWWDDLSAGKTFVFGKKCDPNALSPTKNPTWKSLGTKWSLDVKNPANDHLSYDLAPLSKYNTTKAILSLHRYEM
jgi:hypothetical protein